VHSTCRNRAGFNIKSRPTKSRKTEEPKSLSAEVLRAYHVRFRDIPLQDISKHNIHKLSMSRSESRSSFNEDMWRQIIHFRDLTLRKICKSLEQELPEVPNCRSPKVTRDCHISSGPYYFERTSCLTVQNSRSLKYRSTCHSSVMTRGTHSRSFGHVIRPFPHDMFHPSFHDTSVTVKSYDIRPPRHFTTCTSPGDF
jgi:hypothetical protein